MGPQFPAEALVMVWAPAIPAKAIAASDIVGECDMGSSGCKAATPRETFAIRAAVEGSLECAGRWFNAQCDGRGECSAESAFSGVEPPNVYS